MYKRILLTALIFVFPYSQDQSKQQKKHVIAITCKQCREDQTPNQKELEIRRKMVELQKNPHVKGYGR